jgi:hypothetical protein
MQSSVFVLIAYPNSTTGRTTTNILLLIDILNLQLPTIEEQLYSILYNRNGTYGYYSSLSLSHIHNSVVRA